MYHKVRILDHQKALYTLWRYTSFLLYKVIRYEIMGRRGVGEQKEKGEVSSEFCVFKDLPVKVTLLTYKFINKKTWKSSSDKREIQIDHIENRNLAYTMTWWNTELMQPWIITWL